jgi:hypothetical protein
MRPLTYHLSIPLKLSLPIGITPAHINVREGAVAADAATEKPLSPHLCEDLVQRGGRTGEIECPALDVN